MPGSVPGNATGRSPVTRRAAGGTLRDASLWALTFAYLLSQFFRSYVAVIAPQLIADFGFSPRMFGLFAGSFFLIFALAQLPLGIAFDRFGVRRPMVACMTVGTVGAIVLPLVHGATSALVAQAALGIGCAPIFMGLLNYVLKSGHGTQQVRAVTTASGLGIVGALIAAFPLAWSSSKIGWRASMSLGAVAMLVATCGIAIALRRETVEPHAQDDEGRSDANAGKVPRGAFITLLPVCFAMSAGATFRTSWGGPYFADVFHLDVVARGHAMTLASLAALVVSLLLPVVVRIVPIKSLSLGCMTLGLAAAVMLAVQPARSAAISTALICVLFCVGAIHPLVMSQARSITARRHLGMRLGVLNSMVFLGVAVTSNCFGWIAEGAEHSGLTTDALYTRLFVFTAVVLVVGTVSYVFSPRVRAAAGS